MKKISFQGLAGAYSEQACKNAYPNYQPIACRTFQESMHLVESGECKYAMIPLENSTAGRVEEIYRLIPKLKLHVIGEHYEEVNHALIGIKGANIEELKCVGSHPQALAQCHNNIQTLGLEMVAKFDTAGAAKDLSIMNDPTKAAIASKLAAEIYGLEVLMEHFEDLKGNMTRFFVLSKKKSLPLFKKENSYITSLIFELRNIPASLYKALGGFATNSINLLKIESYMHSRDKRSRFHIDIDAHIDENRVKLALEELSFFAENIKILGVFEQRKVD